MKFPSILFLPSLLSGFYLACDAAPSQPLSLSLSPEEEGIRKSVDDGKREGIPGPLDMARGALEAGEKELAEVLQNAGNALNPSRFVANEANRLAVGTLKSALSVGKGLTMGTLQAGTNAAKRATRITEEGVRSSIAIAGGLVNVMAYPLRIAGTVLLFALELTIRGTLLFLRTIGYPLTLATRSAIDLVSIVPSFVELARNVTRATSELARIARSPLDGIDPLRIGLGDILDPANLFGTLTRFLRTSVPQATWDALTLALQPFFPLLDQRVLSLLDSSLQTAINAGKLPDGPTPLQREFDDVYQMTKGLGYV